MSTEYVESGRTRQKQRTRDHLIAAARELIKAGDTPRVEEVAEAAGISRPTAYRYFASQAELLAVVLPASAMGNPLTFLTDVFELLIDPALEVAQASPDEQLRQDSTEGLASG